MISAGGQDLPDVFINVPMSDNTITRYAKTGFILPLTDYYKHSSYYIKDMMEKEPDLAKMITMTDGNIYVVPRYMKIMQNEFGYRLWIYTPWLDMLGLKMPSNLEEFKTILRAFKEKDPNGNGIADEIPYMGATNAGEQHFMNFILAAYLPIDPQSNYLYVENGQIKAAYMQNEFKEGLKYLHELCKEGLLSPASFTTVYEQLRQIVQNPSVVQVGSFTSMAPTYLNSSDQRKEGYKIVPPLTQVNGKGYAMYSPSIPANAFFITKNCKYPEAAFRMADIMISEEATIHSRWGVKGVDWVEPEEGEKGMFDAMGYKAKIKPILAWGSPQNSHWQNVPPAYRDYSISFGIVESGSNLFETEIANKLQSYLDKKPPESITKIIYTDDEMDFINEVQQNVDAYLKDSMASFVTGTTDIEEGWDDYINEMKNIGVEDMIKMIQNAYDRMSNIRRD